MVDTPVDAARPVSPGVSAWWRAATIALLVLLSIAGAAGASMFAQFTAQIEHVQSKLKATAQIKYLAVLFDEHTDIFDAVDPDLMLEGLAILAQRAKAAS